jgi:hypothetical protein
MGIINNQSSGGGGDGAKGDTGPRGVSVSNISTIDNNDGSIQLNFHMNDGNTYTATNSLVSDILIDLNKLELSGPIYTDKMIVKNQAEEEILKVDTVNNNVSMNKLNLDNSLHWEKLTVGTTLTVNNIDEEAELQASVLIKGTDTMQKFSISDSQSNNIVNVDTLNRSTRVNGIFAVGTKLTADSNGIVTVEGDFKVLAENLAGDTLLHVDTVNNKVDVGGDLLSINSNARTLTINSETAAEPQDAQIIVRNTNTNTTHFATNTSGETVIIESDFAIANDLGTSNHRVFKVDKDESLVSISNQNLEVSSRAVVDANPVSIRVRNAFNDFTHFISSSDGSTLLYDSAFGVSNGTRSFVIEKDNPIVRIIDQDFKVLTENSDPLLHVDNVANNTVIAGPDSASKLLVKDSDDNIALSVNTNDNSIYTPSLSVNTIISSSLPSLLTPTTGHNVYWDSVDNQIKRNISTITAGYEIFLVSQKTTGTITASTWNRHLLNTIEYNTLPAGISLSSNTIINIPAGTWRISATATVNKIYSHTSTLFVLNSGTTLSAGNVSGTYSCSGYVQGGTDSSAQINTIECVHTIPSGQTRSMGLWTYSSGTQSGNGQGLNWPSGGTTPATDYRYAHIFLQRLA